MSQAVSLPAVASAPPPAPACPPAAEFVSPHVHTARTSTSRVVVLNASYELLSVVGIHRAIVYLLREKAEIVARRDGVTLRSASGFQLPVPSVVRLRRYVRVPYRHRVPTWSKAGLLRRDGHTCAYCGRRGSTVEHLVPSSRGGPTTWMNTVIACIECNTRKRNRTPSEAHMTLLRPPTVPTVQTALLLALAQPERDVLAELGVLENSVSVLS